MIRDQLDLSTFFLVVTKYLYDVKKAIPDMKQTYSYDFRRQYKLYSFRRDSPAGLMWWIYFEKVKNMLSTCKTAKYNPKQNSTVITTTNIINSIRMAKKKVIRLFFFLSGPLAFPGHLAGSRFSSSPRRSPKARTKTAWGNQYAAVFALKRVVPYFCHPRHIVGISKCILLSLYHGGETLTTWVR